MRRGSSRWCGALRSPCCRPAPARRFGFSTTSRCVPPMVILPTCCPCLFLQEGCSALPSVQLSSLVAQQQACTALSKPSTCKALWPCTPDTIPRQDLTMCSSILGTLARSPVTRHTGAVHALVGPCSLGYTVKKATCSATPEGLCHK